MKQPALLFENDNFDISVSNGNLLDEHQIISDVKLTLFSDSTFWGNYVEIEDKNKLGSELFRLRNESITNQSINEMRSIAKKSLEFLLEKYDELKDIEVNISLESVDRIKTIINLILKKDKNIEVIL